MTQFRRRIASVLVGAMVSTGFSAPLTSMAAEDMVARRTLIHDVSLGRGNTLTGVVLTSSGQPRADAPVHVAFKDVVVAKTVSDRHGRFALRLTHGGVHQVSVASGAPKLCRFWMPGTAPPSAESAVTLLSDEIVVRGQLLGALGGIAGGVSASTVAVTAVAVGVGAMVATEMMDEDEDAS